MEKTINRPYHDKVVHSIGYYTKEMFLYNHIHPRDYIKIVENKTGRLSISVCIDDAGCDFEIDKETLLFFLVTKKRARS